VVGSGGGTRTPDTRIMMPGLCPVNQQLVPTKTVNPASEDQKLSGILSNPLIADGSRLANATTTISDQDVREPGTALPPAPVLTLVTSPPAHPSNRLVTQLNRNWRVADDPLQWILQRRKGNPRKKNSGWENRSFCTTREALLRCVREYCGEVDQHALADLQVLPKHHAHSEQPK
jgi:hypothetical protein